MSNPQRSKIGIFVQTFPQVSETFIVTKVLKLLDAGFDIEIFCARESPHWDNFAILAGRDDVRARVHVLPPTSSLDVLAKGVPAVIESAIKHPRDFARYVAHCWRTRRETKHGFLKSLYLRTPFVGTRLDVLHIEFDVQAIGIADLKEFLSARVLYSSRGTFQQLSIVDTMPAARDYLFRYVDAYHFISRFCERNTVELGLSPDIPTWLIEPAVDLGLFAPRPRAERKPDDALRIISVGRLAWEKGHELALDAVERARRAGVAVDFTIYGAGPYEEPVRFAIQQLGLADCARLGGVLRREDIPSAYANADVLLHAALAEGFSNSVIEAQAMELPVITTDAGGLPENVEHGVSGFVVPRRDPEAMASRLVELARDPDLARKLGRCGRERAIARFDLNRQAEAFVKLYTELASLPLRPVS